MALDHGLELARHIAVREHDRLAAQRAALGAADVEHIGQPCDVRERYIGICRQAVAEARAIEEERQIECLAHGGNALQLVFRVKRAVFGRMGDIDHAREYHVVMAFVRVERLDVLAQIVRVQLAVPVRNGQHLVSGALDGAGLMGVHMAAGGRDNAFIRTQQRVDDNHVGLRAAGEEVNLSLRAGAGRLDLLRSGRGDLVISVAGERLHIGLRQMFQNFGVCAVTVIVYKKQHDFSPLNVKIHDIFRISFNKFATRLYLFAHQERKGLIGRRRILHRDLKQRAVLGIHSGLPQLLRVHLAEALVALYAHAVSHFVDAVALLLLSVGIADVLALLVLEQRRLRDEHMAVLDQRTHEAEEERQK